MKILPDFIFFLVSTVSCVFFAGQAAAQIWCSTPRYHTLSCLRWGRSWRIASHNACFCAERCPQRPRYSGQALPHSYSQDNAHPCASFLLHGGMKPSQKTQKQILEGIFTLILYMIKPGCWWWWWPGRAATEPQTHVEASLLLHSCNFNPSFSSNSNTWNTSVCVQWMYRISWLWKSSFWWHSD